MSAAMTLESLVVAVIVLGFALRAMFQLFPAASRRGFAKLLAMAGFSSSVAPTIASHCDTGCGSCNNCGTGRVSARQTEAPIEFRATTPKR